MKQPLSGTHRKFGKKVLFFDIFYDGRCLYTLEIPVTFDIIYGYEGDTPLYNMDKIAKYAEKVRPTIKYINYSICIN